LNFLLFAFVALIPWTVLSTSFAGFLVEPSLITAAMIAGITAFRIFSHRIAFGEEEVWAKPFWAFLFFATISLILSPYILDAGFKGGVQEVGIVIYLLVAVAITRLVVETGFRGLARTILLSTAVVASIGIWQFIALNFIGTTLFTDFSWVSELISDTSNWRPGDFYGDIHRINSVDAEPAHFAQYLGIGAGFALMRIGFLGHRFRAPLENAIPLWAAYSILIGIFLSLSLVGYFMIGILMASLVMIVRKDKMREIFRGFTVAALCFGALLSGSVFFSIDEQIRTKLDTVPMIVSSAFNGVTEVSTESISALALGANASVAIANLRRNPLLGAGIGAHPIACRENLPNWVTTDLEGLSTGDAGSLFVRLVSETGLVGAFLFILGWVLVVKRACIAIRDMIRAHEFNGTDFSLNLVLAVGITASCIALFITYLCRMGSYYAPTIWFLLALDAAVPKVLKFSSAGPFTKDLGSDSKELSDLSLFNGVNSGKQGNDETYVR
jgi:hypothetical protein